MPKLRMLKAIKRILGIRTSRISTSEPNLRQYLIDHTVVSILLNMIAKDRERMQQSYEEMRQRKARSVRSWDVCAVETDAEESECR